MVGFSELPPPLLRLFTQLLPTITAKGQPGEVC